MYYLSILGKDMGPFTLEELQELAKQGRLSEDTVVKVDGKTMKAGEVEGVGWEEIQKNVPSVLSSKFKLRFFPYLFLTTFLLSVCPDLYLTPLVICTFSFCLFFGWLFLGFIFFRSVLLGCVHFLFWRGLICVYMLCNLCPVFIRLQDISIFLQIALLGMITIMDFYYMYKFSWRISPKHAS